jgi:hypothetical protein
MSRSLLAQGSRHLPPWLIFTLGGKPKTYLLAVQPAKPQKPRDDEALWTM